MTWEGIAESASHPPLRVPIEWRSVCARCWLVSLYCTKIASKLVRTYTDRHGLKDLAGELLGVEISKQQQSSDWAAKELSQQQLAYAASDVLHLHALKEKLDAMLERDKRREFADAAFKFLPVRAKLDIAGFGEDDIFSH